MINQMIRRVKNSIHSALAKWGQQYAYDTLPPETLRAVSSIPMVRAILTQFSIEEYDRNPHYQHVIENLANHTLGPHPGIIGISRKVEERHNDEVEDNHLLWVSENGIGRSYREIRRQAAKTGIGLGIPFIDRNTDNAVRVAYKVYGGNSLKTPNDAQIGDRIYNGIEYDRNWEVSAFHLRDTDSDLIHNMSLAKDTKEYRIHEVIYWGRGYKDGVFWPVPECAAAFTFYPYLRRFLQAVIEGEEFHSSFPMAIELDPNIYSAYRDEVKGQIKELQGTFEYEPKMVPTLKPGMKLEGIPHSVSSKDREQTMRMFASTCALTVQMPKNLALGDSSNANMAASQVDIQPWANKVGIDRFDMEPMFRKSFKNWWSIASLNVLPRSVLAAHPFMFPHIYVYPDLFEHPDPNKRAAARAQDLASGATTLNRLYSNRGMNFRREMKREAEALGIEVAELIEIIVSSRSVQALSVLENNTNLSQE